MEVSYFEHLFIVEHDLCSVLRLTVITPNTTEHPSSTAVSFWTIACQPRILIFVGKGFVRNEHRTKTFFMDI
jgi:hypothetical protein